jgi:hypothetical protein
MFLETENSDQLRRRLISHRGRQFFLDAVKDRAGALALPFTTPIISESHPEPMPLGSQPAVPRRTPQAFNGQRDSLRRSLQEKEPDPDQMFVRAQGCEPASLMNRAEEGDRNAKMAPRWPMSRLKETD